MTNHYPTNLSLLQSRFPRLAAMLAGLDPETVGVADAQDGGICYAMRNASGQWGPISSPTNPIELATKSIRLMENRLFGGLCPAVVVGLAPGYVLDTVFRHFESRLAHHEPFRPIYVIVDSLPCLAAWMKATDRSAIISRQEVLFYWKDDVRELVRLCQENEQRSHLFIPVSELPENVVNHLIEPLAALYVRREKETAEMRKENDAYYDAISDEQLAQIISGSAGRKPRLLMPTHTSSTVVQYSTRDTCTAFEKIGWETRILKMDLDLPPWRMVKTIHDFKPDLLIFIIHLRNEDENVKLYPDNLMFITWVQDAVPLINRRDTAQKWTEMARGKATP